MSQNKNIQVLIIEDEPAHAEILSDILDSAGGMDIALAKNLEDGLRTITCSPPDIILIDLHLPDGSAIDLLPKVDGQIPVITLTSRGSEEQAVEVLKAGALDYLTKSAETFAALPRLVERALSQWRLQREKELAIAALGENELRYRTLFQDVQAVAIQGYRSDGTIIFWNKASENLYGYTEKETLGQNLLELIIPETLKDRVLQAFQSMGDSHPLAHPSGELSLRHKDGRILHMLTSHAVLTGTDGLPELYSFDIDISERKAMESLVREQKALLEALLQDTAIALFVIDQDHRVIAWNRACEELTGINGVDIIGTRDHWRAFFNHKRPCLADTVLDNTDPETLASLYPQLTESSLVAGAVQAEGWYSNLGGAERYILFTASAVRNADGVVIAVIESLQDVTARKLVDQAHKRSHQLLSKVINSLDSVVYVADMDTCEILFINEIARKAFGDIVGQTCWKSLQEGLTGPCEFCTNDKLVDDQGSPTGVYVWEFQNTINKKWYECRDIAIEWTDGRLVRMEIATDISNRKRNEIELRKLSLAVEQSPAAVIITDLDGCIEYVNPKFTKVTGYSFAEVSGENPRMLQSGLVDRAIYHQMWACLLAGEEWQGEFINRHKKGHIFWERSTISPLRSSDGKVTHYIGVKEDITTQKNYEKQLEHQATHDDLTGASNRILLQDRLEQAIHHCERQGNFTAVIFIDLDRFKLINDSLGHAVGDELLRMVATRLKNTVRESDTVARFGGDEFVVVLTELTTAEKAGKVATKIIEGLHKPYQLSGREITVTASLGLSIAPIDGRDITSLIYKADTAMYESKKHKIHFSYYCEEMNREHLAMLELEGDLRQALERKEFYLHYQPLIDIKTGHIFGCEALLRWQHPQRGIIPPGQFIPLAEDTGLIIPIGTWALEEACRQCLEWQQMDLPKLSIAINLSALQFRQGNTVELVKNVLDRFNLDPTYIELELTESMIMDNPVAARKTLNELKQIGLSLSLDDFGTGYSSLNYLRRFPFDCLKIDQSFIHDVIDDPTGASVVTSIIGLAHNLNLSAIAEGVETLEQLQFLKQCGCEAAQGYLFSKPVSAHEFQCLLSSGKTFNLV